MLYVIDQLSVIVLVVDIHYGLTHVARLTVSHIHWNERLIYGNQVFPFHFEYGSIAVPDQV